MEILRFGSRGPEVELLQTALSRAGFLSGAPDGIFGNLTQSAVVAFQQAYALMPDGIVGALTWAALHPFLTGYITWEKRQGETPSILAARFNTSVQALEAANPGLETLPAGTALTIPLNFNVVPDNISFTSELLSLCIEGLLARYPFIKASVIGSSVLGQDIYALDIGTGTNRVMYNASHHANEWITTPVLMKFAEQLSAVYSGLDIPYLRPIAEEIYNKSIICFVPMVNPDGVNLVTGAIKPGSAAYESARAMNYLRLPFPSGWKANISGVDLNLNYPAGWETAREIKFAQGYTQPGPRDYVGPSPLSEPESIAMAELTRSRDFALTLSYHTQGEVIFWKYADYLPPRSLEIVRLLSRVSGYAYEETPYASGNAGYKDWFIQEYNRPGYTIEAGLGVNPLPLSQFAEIYRDNVGILALSALV